MSKQRLSLDDQLEFVKLMWANKAHIKRKIVVKQLGPSYYSVGFDKTSEELISEIKQQNHKTISIFYKIRKFLIGF